MALDSVASSGLGQNRRWRCLFKITMNGERQPLKSSEGFRDVVRDAAYAWLEGAVLAPPPAD
jgi:hypothetical protein